MTTKRLGKKLLKITGISFGILLVLLTGFHFWFKAHAKELIEDIVESKSKGKLKLKIGKFHFGYFNRKMELENAVFYSTDSANANTSYSFSVRKIKLDVQAIWPIVFQKKLLINSLTLIDPDIQVTRLKASLNDSVRSRKDVSIPEEMGKVYHSIQDALQVLKVTEFQINNGKFTLINKIQAGQLPLTITNISFRIDNLHVGAAWLAGKEKILFSDNVVLHSSNQDIIFPDGRHRLSFSNFRINLQKKVVEFDSCTIAATRTDSSANSFKVFFDSLFLTNIDFDTLYRHEVIKADSVYCINPKFDLDVEVGKKRPGAKSPPKLENIIKQLTGDLLLGYVIVSNAGINIRTVKNDKPSTFTFSQNNFEMQGLSIDQDDAKPIKVKSFVMAIRNYENFIKDSSYRLQFDSVLFRNDRIYLSNFIFHKLDKGRITNSFNIPQLYLGGLSWDDLVFDNKLKADQATLFNPSIDYTVSEKQRSKSGGQNIFHSISAINDYMDLEYMDIIDGTINLKIKDDLQVQLTKANLSIQSHSLLSSTDLPGLKKSLNSLSFEKGIIRAGDLTLDLQNIHYTGNTGQFSAGHVSVKDKANKMDILAQDVDVEKMLVNERTGDILAENIKWQKADVKINVAKSKQENSAPVISLRKIQGANTFFSGTWSNQTVSTELSRVSIDELKRSPGNKLTISGLAAEGQQLQVKDKNSALSIADYHISDHVQSSFRQVVYKGNNGKMNTTISIPSVTLIPHIQSLLSGDIALDDISIVKPVIDLYLSSVPSLSAEKKPGFPKLDINEIKLQQPQVTITRKVKDSSFFYTWNGGSGSSDFLRMTGLHGNGVGTGISLSDLRFYLSNFVFTGPKGKTFSTRKEKVSAQLRDISLEQKGDRPLNWSAVVSSVEAKDLLLDSLGKANGSMAVDNIVLKELAISSATVSDIQKLVARNSRFQVGQLNGHYLDANKEFRWYNAGFNRNSNLLTADSFSFRPALDKDSFLTKQAFQTDYIKVRTGAIRIGPVDVGAYINNRTLKAGLVSIDDVLMTDYKEKSLPFNPGIIKPMPVASIKNIPARLSIDTLQLNNARVEYTESSEKTKVPGTMIVGRMFIRSFPIKNYDLRATDSLRIQADAYLMDTAWTRLRLKMSYTDSLGGFLMTAQMKPVDVTVFNPVLIPLASLKLESGFLDTLHMKAVGREYFTLGEMKMFYHDLKIRLFKNGDQTKKASLLNFLANSFVLKKKNNSRTGDVFFIRNRDRSAINYLIKIAMSGITSSVGVKSTKKLMRKHKDELKNRVMPSFNFD